ncbi:Disulfide bond formation B [Gossypium arboreum]|uniref:Disulfide bond formation B n=1 Tax=Gossypium arboreum TaxID=29729 RepID=A0A0B0NW56_GOSAR|nr:Disulfide bond formation B [Gossypium arboreum]
MSETCIGFETRAIVRHVWDMHRPRDMCASVRPCLGHGIDTDG